MNNILSDFADEAMQDLAKHIALYEQDFRKAREEYIDDCIGYFDTYDMEYNQKSPDPSDYMYTSDRLTIGVTFTRDDSGELADYSYSFQTGDNSFTGPAYGHKHWIIFTLFNGLSEDGYNLREDIFEQLPEDEYL